MGAEYVQSETDFPQAGPDINLYSFALCVLNIGPKIKVKGFQRKDAEEKGRKGRRGKTKPKLLIKKTN